MPKNFRWVSRRALCSFSRVVPAACSSRAADLVLGGGELFSLPAKRFGDPVPVDLFFGVQLPAKYAGDPVPVKFLRHRSPGEEKGPRGGLALFAYRGQKGKDRQKRGLGGHKPFPRHRHFLHGRPRGAQGLALRFQSLFFFLPLPKGFVAPDEETGIVVLARQRRGRADDPVDPLDNVLELGGKGFHRPVQIRHHPVAPLALFQKEFFRAFPPRRIFDRCKKTLRRRAVVMGVEGIFPSLLSGHLEPEALHVRDPPGVQRISRGIGHFPEAVDDVRHGLVVGGRGHHKGTCPAGVGGLHPELGHDALEHGGFARSRRAVHRQHLSVVHAEKVVHRPALGGGEGKFPRHGAPMFARNPDLFVRRQQREGWGLALDETLQQRCRGLFVEKGVVEGLHMAGRSDGGPRHEGTARDAGISREVRRGGRPRHGFKVLPAHPGRLLPRDLFRSPGGKGGESGVGVFDGAHGDAVVVEGLKKGPGNPGKTRGAQGAVFSQHRPDAEQGKGRSVPENPVLSGGGVDPGTKGPLQGFFRAALLFGDPLAPVLLVAPLGVDEKFLKKDRVVRQLPRGQGVFLPPEELRPPVLPRHIGVLLRRVAQRVAVIRKNPPRRFLHGPFPPVTCAPPGAS